MYLASKLGDLTKEFHFFTLENYSRNCRSFDEHTQHLGREIEYSFGFSRQASSHHTRWGYYWFLYEWIVSQWITVFYGRSWWILKFFWIFFTFVRNKRMNIRFYFENGSVLTSYRASSKPFTLWDDAFPAILMHQRHRTQTSSVG